MNKTIDMQITNCISLATKVGETYKIGECSKIQAGAILDDLDRLIMGLPSDPRDRKQAEMFRVAGLHINKVRSEVTYVPGAIIANPLR